MKDSLGFENEVVLELDEPETDDYFAGKVVVELDASETNPIMLQLVAHNEQGREGVGGGVGYWQETFLTPSQARLIASALLLAAYRVDGQTVPSQDGDIEADIIVGEEPEAPV